MHSRLLGGLTPAQFLARHWQKRPLLVRGAVPEFADPLTPDELAGLALEAGVSSRLVMEKGGKRPWQLEHGPFTARRLAALPPSHWTLLVTNVEQRVEAAAALLDRFTFLPHWRADDLMVSFAAPAGSVGPHADTYDVFLLQGRGRRRWGIASDYPPALRRGVDLKLLARFSPEAEWVLAPGDMLYLPPGVAHYGVALEECLTYSVGFRAPSRADLVGDLYNLPFDLAALAGDDELYADPDLAVGRNPGEISAPALQRVEAMVRAPLERDGILGRWFGGFITRPAPGRAAPRGRRPAAARVSAMLAGQRPIWRHDAVRVAYYAPPGKLLYFYAGGEELGLPRALAGLAEQVCAARCQTGRELARALPRGGARADGLGFLAELFARGVLYLGA